MSSCRRTRDALSLSLGWEHVAPLAQSREPVAPTADFSRRPCRVVGCRRRDRFCPPATRRCVIPLATDDSRGSVVSSRVAGVHTPTRWAYSTPLTAGAAFGDDRPLGSDRRCEKLAGHRSRFAGSVLSAGTCRRSSRRSAGAIGRTRSHVPRHDQRGTGFRVFTAWRQPSRRGPLGHRKVEHGDVLREGHRSMLAEWDLLLDSVMR
jgi:hypothetical protein